MMKKISLFLVVASMLLALAGCGSSEPENVTPPKGAASTPGQIGGGGVKVEGTQAPAPN